MSTNSMAVILPAAALIAAAASAQTFRYNVTELPPLADQSSVSLNAINNRGEVVGVSYGSPITNQTPYVYRPGQGMTALPFPPGYAFSVPTDINDSGVIVGYAQPTWSAEQSMVAWKYENGQFTMYPGVTFGNNINNNGTIVGRTCLSGTQLTCYFLANPGGPLQNFGSANFYSSSNWRFVDINDDNYIAYTGSPGAQAQLRAPDGTLTAITPPPSPFVRTFTWAVNNSEQVAGRWEYNIGSQYFSRAFIWAAATGAQQIGINNNHVRPKGLNNLGQVVGESGTNQNSYLDMWLWSPGVGNEDIEPLIDPSYQLVLTSVWGINDRGQILAIGTTQVPPARNMSVILTPVAPPCPADFNGDSTVDFFDYLDFVDAFSSAQSRADFNGDSVIDFFDYLDFVDAFSAGC